MEDSKAIISDLKGLINILNDGKEGYESASETTESIELQGLFLKYSAQRAAFADDLKAHLEQHGGESENETGGLLGALHRTWIDIKQALTSKEDVASLMPLKPEKRQQSKNSTRRWMTLLPMPTILNCCKNSAPASARL